MDNERLGRYFWGTNREDSANSRLADRDLPDRNLIARLRRDGIAERPPFSPQLHARLSKAIESEAANRPVLRVEVLAGRNRANLMGLVVGGLVAAVVVALVLVIPRKPASTMHDFVAASANQSRTQSLPADAPKPASDSGLDDLSSMAEIADQAQEQVQSWFAPTSQEKEWDGLDRGLQAAVQSIGGPLPIDVFNSLASDEP